MIHLHWHSTFSFLEAIWKIDDIVGRAKELWMQSIAITDYNGLYGAIKFYQKAKSEQINPIIWLETGFVLDINDNINKENIWNICILAKSKVWYQNLLKIASYTSMEWLSQKPKIDIECLKKYNEWLIVFMWDINSRIWKMILSKQSMNKISEIIQILIDVIWKNNVFLEIIAQDYKKVPMVAEINQQIAIISQKLWIPQIVSTNYHYSQKNQKEAREMALAIKDGFKMYDDHRRKPPWDYHIASQDEITKILIWNWFSETEIKKLIAQNMEIWEQIKIDLELYQTLFPNYESPPEIVSLYQKYSSSLVV